MKALRKLFVKQEAVELVDVDELYKETIAHLPEKARIQYCESLIERCTMDADKVRSEVEKIDQLMSAAKLEIERISK